jgi:uncharacterized membrane protein|tara:strand:- start:4 stop:483 length:480 start_codon:yes stop_codon:yes gene_type:complete
MNGILNTVIWSLIPISELRGGIPVGVASGLSIFAAFLIAIVANFFVIPIVFFFLDHLHELFLKVKIYDNIFNHYIEKKRGKLEKHIGTKWEFVMLMLFVGIPLPITGAYTGTLLAWFFKVPRKKAYFALSLGIVIAGLIVSLVVGLGLRAFGFFIKHHI